MVFRGEKVVFGPNVQSGYGLGRFFRNVGRVFKPIVNPVLKEVKGIGLSVGSNLLENLVQDILSGKSSKASVKARGKQSRDMALQLALQKALRNQKGRGLFDTGFIGIDTVQKPAQKGRGGLILYDTLQKALKQQGKGIGRFWGKKSKTKSKNPANLKRRAILGKIGNVIKPILKETKGIVSDVGANFLGNVIQDVLTGKSVKTSLKARGKEAGVNATNMSIQRALQLQKGIKRKRSRSKSKSSAKRKRSQSKSKSTAKRKRTKSTKRKRSNQSGGNLKNKRTRSKSKSSTKHKRNQIGGADKRVKSVKKRKTPRKQSGSGVTEDIFSNNYYNYYKR